MDKEKATKVLEAYGKPTFESGNNVISFARQNEQDISTIEAISDNELIKEWKRLVWLNEIYGQVSLNEMQRINLLELEMDDRPNINDNDLTIWYDSELDKFNKSNPNL
jgi:hypothetical protein